MLWITIIIVSFPKAETSYQVHLQFDKCITNSSPEALSQDP